MGFPGGGKTIPVSHLIRSVFGLIVPRGSEPVTAQRQARLSRSQHGCITLEPLEARLLLAADPVIAQFTDVTALHGLNTIPGGSGEFHAGGAIFTDLTNDDFADLYNPNGNSPGTGSTNFLHVNVSDGSGGRTFVRVVNDGGTGGSSTRSTGAVAADYDNDGDLDIYVTEYHADNILYKNMWVEDHPAGGGNPTDLRYVDVTSLTDPTPTNPAGDIQHGVGFATFQNPDPVFGNDRLDGSLSAAWADVNRDGFVDLYVGNWDGTNGDPGTARDGQLGERDTLYLNNGDGTFTDITMGPNGIYITPPPAGVSLLDDGSFESAASGTQTSNSDWGLNAGATPSAVFQAAPWAATRGVNGVWFQGFLGTAANPVNATLTQTITVADSGVYNLTFDANVEVNFEAAEFKITFSSNGTGGSDPVDILTATPDFNTFNQYTLSLPGVTAGDQLTVLVEMIDAAVPAPGPSQSVLMDNFVLELSGSGGGTPTGWEQVGGWAFDDFGFNDTGLPGEFSGLNAMQFADFNNDGWQDIIVATMGGGGGGPNRDMLYVNRGNDALGDWLGYHLISWEIGFGGNDSGDMGVTVTDFDNDGDLDYYSTDGGTAHSLWLNQFVDTGSLTFVETFITGVFAWGANFHDFDNNGRADLVIGTQNNRPPLLHLQDTDGNLTEQAVTAGLTNTNGQRATIVADFDRDGFSDLFYHNIFNSGGNPLGVELLHNNSAALNPNFHYLNITLEGDPTLPGPIKSTRDAIGARVYVTADFDGNGTVAADETRMEEVLSGHSQAASTSSLALEFGTGHATTADVRIVWGSGREHTMTLATDQFLTFNEGDLSAIPGDLSGDGFVGLTDLNIVLGNWNQNVPPADPLADPSGDGFVGIDDLNAVLGNWNAGTPPVQEVSASSSAAAVTVVSTEPSNEPVSEPVTTVELIVASSNKPIRTGKKNSRHTRQSTHEQDQDNRTAIASHMLSQQRATRIDTSTHFIPLSLRPSDHPGPLGLWENADNE